VSTVFLSEWWSDNQTFIEIVIVYALVAFSVQVPLKAGTFSLASIGFYGISSYTAAYLAMRDWPTVLAIAAGVVVSGVIGWLLALLLVRLGGLYLGMATIAFDLMVGVVALNWVSVTGGPAGLFGIPIVVDATGMLAVLVVVVVLLALMQRGTLGRTFEATREDSQLALTVGIDTRRYQRFAFVISAMLGGLAGALHALAFSTIAPEDASFAFVILALAMVIIGGFASWVGALVGAIVLAALPLQLTFLGQWWPIIYGIAMILVGTYLPGGLYALFKRGWIKLRSISRTAPPSDAGAPAGPAQAPGLRADKAVSR
jgi:branched-chain amino acid transport system permease protein